MTTQTLIANRERLRKLVRLSLSRAVDEFARRHNLPLWLPRGTTITHLLIRWLESGQFEVEYRTKPARTGDVVIELDGRQRGDLIDHALNQLVA